MSQEVNRSRARGRLARSARASARLGPCLCLLVGGVAWGQPAATPPRGGGQAPAPPATAPEVRADVPLAEIGGLPPAGRLPAGAAEDETAVQARCDAAIALLTEGHYARAVIELDAAIKGSDQPGADLLLLMARAKRGLGRDGEARLVAELALLQRPDSVEAHLLLGRLHREQGRLDAAIAHLRSATRVAGRAATTGPGADVGALPASAESDQPAAALAWYELGELLAEAGYLRAAVEAMAQFDLAVSAKHSERRDDGEVAELVRRHPHGLIERQLELLRPLDRPAERVALAEQALRNRPDEPYVERLYVQTLVESGQTSAAFDFCRQRLAARPAAPSSAESAPVAAETLLSLALETGRSAGRLDAWVAELADGVRAGRGVDLATQLARRLDAGEDVEHAVVLWHALAEAQPESAEFQWALANALRAGGDLAAALGTLIEFVRACGDEAEIPPERLAAWMRSFEATDDFLHRVREFTDRRDSDFATFTVLATTAAAAGQTELAERLFGIALEERPEFALARVGRGRMWLSAGRWEEAKAEAEAALAASPRMAAAHFLCAEAHTGLDEHDAAEAAYKSAAEARPDETAYVLALARHYRRTGNLLSAQRYFQEAWSVDPSLGDAVEELIDCYLEGGKAEIASNVLQQAEARDLPADTLRRIRTALRFAAAPMQEEHLVELSRQWEEHPEDVTTGLKLAAGLYLHQRPDEALPVARQVRALAPDDERAVYVLAQIHLRRIEGAEALTLLEAMARRHPRRPQALRLLADAYLVEFRIDEARRTFERFLELPVSAEQRDAARLGLLATYLGLADYDGAVQRVDAWLAAEPDAEAWARAKLRVLLAAQRESEAVAWATLRLEPATRRFEELRRRAQTLVERLRSSPGDVDAQAQMKNIERELAVCVSGLYERRAEWVQVCLDAERYGTAERQVRLWLAEQPEQFQLQEWLIQALLAGEQAEAALSACEKLVPTSAAETLSALLWRSRCRAAAGKLDLAIDDLTRLMAEGFVQESPLARDQLRQEIVGLLVDAGEEERAVATCERWLNELPTTDRLGRMGVLRLLRYVLGAVGRLDEQAEVMERLLEFQPHDPGLNNDLGYTWADRGERLARAMKMVRLAVAAEPLNGAYLDSLGWVSYKTGRFDAARTYLSRAVQLRGGQDAVVRDHLGDAEYRLGDHAAARRQWQQALTLLEMPGDAVGSEELLAAIRNKLAALDRSEPPAVASTGDEAAQTRPSREDVP